MVFEADSEQVVVQYSKMLRDMRYCIHSVSLRECLICKCVIAEFGRGLTPHAAHMWSSTQEQCRCDNDYKLIIASDTTWECIRMWHSTFLQVSSSATDYTHI